MKSVGSNIEYWRKYNQDVEIKVTVQPGGAVKHSGKNPKAGYVLFGCVMLVIITIIYLTAP